ncbi:MAG: response regulator [Deltaproteobacteria bacterium]|nr:response regulator [Deltaproteobacteria bacterium]
MALKLPNRKNLSESMVLTGVALAAVYWLLESLFYFFSTPGADFLQRLSGTDSYDSWTRIFVLCLFAIFGSHVQYTMNKRRESDERLQDSESKYRTIIESMEEGYFEVDLQGTLTFVNGALCRMADRPAGKLIGTNHRDRTRKESADRLVHAFNQIFLTGESQHISHYEIIRPDESEVTLELSASLIRDKKGEPTGFRVVGRDVSERLRVESEKRRLEAQLQQAQKMEAVGTLASGIAHDFNNIMMGILGNASLMLARIEADHPHHEKLKNIEKYIQNGAELTKQLLGFARGGKYNVKSTAMRDLVTQSAQMFGRTKKEIRIHTSHLKDTWPVEVDRGQIEQVLLNLFVNAWQAMPGGGDLHLLSEDVELDDSYEMPYKVEPGRYVKLSVVDTGVGMDQATQERIFEPFFTTKEMGRGTGLGLASAYGIIKNHGGHINVYSEKGRGTTFNLYLPASDKAVEIETHKPRALRKGNETILLVDDEDITVEVGEEILIELGYTVITARNGLEALAAYKENAQKIDMVILDMIMPDMGGGKTYDELKKINPDIRVLLSSGYSISGEASEILARGCNDFIQKPFNMKQLSEKMRGILDAA